MHETAAEDVSVLIVGGGVVGLCASILLARHGVRSCLVEKHPSTSIHPRARGLNARTMEILTELGLAEEIRHAGRDIAASFGFLRGSSFADALDRKGRPGAIERWLRARSARGERIATKSAAAPCRVTQDRLEPVLLARARREGVDARFATELVAFTENAGGVSATIRDRATDRTSVVRAPWMIGADGARSRVRESLGVTRSGAAPLSHQLNVYFRADLGARVAGREPSMCAVSFDRWRGLFASVDNATRWVLHLAYDPRVDTLASFTPERVHDLVTRAVGVPGLEITILGTMPWESAVRVADRFRAGRVFLAGDAAHVMPPWGGFGANTGIQDAHDLAWKLAAVIHGAAGEPLLDTYEQERRPVALAVSALAGELNDERGLMRAEGMVSVLWSMRKMAPYFVVGYGYQSSAVVSDGARAAKPGTSRLRGEPGTRVPHVAVQVDGVRTSSVALAGVALTFLAGGRGQSWRALAAASGARCLVAGEDFVPESSWERAAGIRAEGALLVRPDGFVAWRSAGASRPERVREIVAAVLSLPG